MAAAAQAWVMLAAEARGDANTFMRLSFRNDQSPTLEPFEQQWFHREWQRMWSTAKVSVLHGATGFGKSEQAIGHLVWRIGNKPNLRSLIIGKKEGGAAKMLRKAKAIIESNDVVRAVFPELRPGDPWNSERLRVANAGIDTTSDTVAVYGVGGSPQGERADFILADDILDFENTLTEASRKQMVDLLDSVVRSRLTTDGQLHIVVNAWHPEDAAFTIGKRPGVVHGVYPAILPNGELLWPKFRTKAWLDDVLETTTETQFARMYLCRPRDEATRIFKLEHIQAARELGRGVRPVRQLERVRRGDRPAFTDPIEALRAQIVSDDWLAVVIGVDLATGKTEAKRKTDRTVFFVLGVHRDGRRQVLWIDSGRWSLDETLVRMVELDQRYKPDAFVVEDNGMQASIVGFMRSRDDVRAEVMAHTTTSEKWHESLGIESIAAELRARRWIVPSSGISIDTAAITDAGRSAEASYRASLTAEELGAYERILTWQQHLSDFSRVGHTPDDVMAGYFANEAVKRRGGTFVHTLAPSPEQVVTEQVKTSKTGAILFGDQVVSDQIPAFIRERFGV